MFASIGDARSNVVVGGQARQNLLHTAERLDVQSACKRMFEVEDARMPLAGFARGCLGGEIAQYNPLDVQLAIGIQELVVARFFATETE